MSRPGEGVRVLLVLGDGETWGDISGASVLVVTAGDADRLESGDLRLRDVRPVAEIGLDDCPLNGGAR